MKLHHADLHNLNSLIHVMKFMWPDRIFHLAAHSYVLDSFVAPADTLHVNVIGTTNLFYAMRWAKIEPLIHIYPSSEVYGQVREDGLPIKEANAFHAASSYAVYKVGEEKLTVG